MPVDVLKFDSQFFNNSDGYKKNQFIVADIIQIMKKLNITTIAVGIETAEQIQFLKSCHCDIVQGYYYYRPMSSQAFDSILEQTMITG